jgi:hypothetical protein
MKSQIGKLCKEQCCGSGSESRSGSVRIRNSLQAPDPIPEVMDSDPDPKQELQLIKNYLKIIKKLAI